MKNIIAESKTSPLTIKVNYTDSHITRGIVLKPDRFNKIGDVDYWSTSSFNLITEMDNEMEIRLGTKLVACNDYYCHDEKCTTKGSIYEVCDVDFEHDLFYIIDDLDDKILFDFSDVPNVWFNFYKKKKDPIVKQVTDKFKNRSKVGIEKYGTTLAENNTDDFLEHLQEELMDATLYIQKLKSQSKEMSEMEMIESLFAKGYFIFKQC
jgi:hypothetical protein